MTQKLPETGNMFVSKSFLERRFRIYNKDLTRLNIQTTYEGVCLYQLIDSLQKMWRSINTITNDPNNPDVVELDAAIKQEDLLHKRAKNQTILMELIPKVEAITRLMGFLKAYMEAQLLFVKELSVRLEGDTRENEIWASTKYNAIIEKIFDDMAEVISWEEDGSDNLLATRLLRKSGQNSLEEHLHEIKEHAKLKMGLPNE